MDCLQLWWTYYSMCKNGYIVSNIIYIQIHTYIIKTNWENIHIQTWIEQTQNHTMQIQLYTNNMSVLQNYMQKTNYTNLCRSMTNCIIYAIKTYIYIYHKRYDTSTVPTHKDMQPKNPCHEKTTWVFLGTRAFASKSSLVKSFHCQVHVAYCLWFVGN